MHPPMRHDLQQGHLLFENLMTQQKSQIDSANLGVRRKITGKLNNPAVPISGIYLGAPYKKYCLSLSLYMYMYICSVARPSSSVRYM